MTDKTFPSSISGPIFEHVGPQKPPPELTIHYAPSKFSGGYPDLVSSSAVPGAPTPDDTMTYHWDFDFTPEQEDEWGLIIKKARRRAEPPDENAMKPHFNTMKLYYQADSPTQAQTVNALKAAIAVIREMWKE